MVFQLRFVKEQLKKKKRQTALSVAVDSSHQEWKYSTAEEHVPANKIFRRTEKLSPGT